MIESPGGRKKSGKTKAGNLVGTWIIGSKRNENWSPAEAGSQLPSGGIALGRLGLSGLATRFEFLCEGTETRSTAPSPRARLWKRSLASGLFGTPLVYSRRSANVPRTLSRTCRESIAELLCRASVTFLTDAGQDTRLFESEELWGYYDQGKKSL